MKRVYSKIGELLVNENFIKDFELDYALNIQKKRAFPRKVGQILLEKNLLNTEDLRRALGLYHGVEAVDLSKTEIDTEALKIIDITTAFKFPCIPYEFTKLGSVKVALSDPANCTNLDILSFKINHSIIPVFAYEREIINEIRFYSSQFK